MADISRCRGKAQVKKMSSGGAVRAAPLRESSAAAGARGAKASLREAKRPRRMAVGGQVQAIQPAMPMSPLAGPVPMAGPGPMAPAQPRMMKAGGEVKPPRGTFIEFGDGPPVKTTGEEIERRSGGRGGKRG